MSKKLVIDGIEGTWTPDIDPLAEVKAAYAAGKRCQNSWRLQPGWMDMNPGRALDEWRWDLQSHDWRIKPEPDVVSYLAARDEQRIWGAEYGHRKANEGYHLNIIKLVRDGETGKLKSAEVL